ncbi:hypothetical protein LUZ60_004346 [Juncus effusus]|nr:hypothetical protein LUZ60_004346 [Juncus effusus]
MLPTYLLFPLLSLPLLFLFTKLKHQKNPPLFPCPTKLPIIGNLHQLGSQPHKSLHKLSHQHGPLMLLQLGSIPTLIISSADALKEVTKSQDISFSGRPFSYGANRFSYNLMSISFAPYGDYWRQARKICILELLSTKRVQSFRSIREQELCNLICNIKNTCSSCSPSYVNLSKMLHALSNRITSRVTFGDGYAANGNYGEILEETQRLLGAFWVADYLPWLGWIDALTGLRGRLERNFKELDEFYDKAIEEHLEDADDHQLGHDDFVNVLLRLHRDPIHGATFTTMDHIKGIITDMFIAGTDTSSAVLTWTMTELMRSPDIMVKTQQEVRKIGTNKSKIKEEDLQHLTYLKLVIKESLRLHPPVPLLLPRETLDDCVIQGRKIPKKTRVFINFRAISLDPNTWGNPEKFWPERFIDKDVDFKGNDFSFVPFGVGRRGCPGINFALVVVELVLANLLFCFDWELPSKTIEDLDLEEEIGLTVHKKNHLCLVPRPFHGGVN